MSYFNTNDLSESFNVFDRKGPRAVINSKKSVPSRKPVTDYLCHSGWGVEPLGSDELVHFGIKGMKWGVRNYQNADGSLTDEGKKRYLKGYFGGQKISDNENLKARALVGLGLKGTLKYGKYIREKDKKAFEDKYGKTKEEQKKNLDKEWDEVSKKEEAERALDKKIGKFDKLSSEEQNGVLKETKKEMDKIRAKWIKQGGLGSIDRKMLDGYQDFYLDKVYSKNKKLIDEWYSKRFSQSFDDLEAYSKMQREYTKKLAKALDLPQNTDTYQYLESWFINFDD